MCPRRVNKSRPRRWLVGNISFARAYVTKQDEKSNRGLESKNDRPPSPMGVKGGCSPQNNREATVILRIFRPEVSKKDFETE